MTRRLLIGLLRVTPFIVLGLIGGFFYYGHDLPDVSLPKTRAEVPSVLFVDSAGEPLAVRGGNFYGTDVTWQMIPKHLTDALIATEDRRFFQHSGWDWRGILRALWTNLWAGGVVEGGSTLTQQLAKNLFLTPHRSIKRKIQEWLLAVLLEVKYDKQEIMTLYLNRVYMGHGLWGISAAAAVYFGKSVSSLDIYESALLVGLLRAPSRYAPSASREAAHARTRQVLQNMVEDGRLEQAEATYLATNRFPPVPTVTSQDHMHYFIDWTYDSVVAHLGAIEEDVIVHTTLDSTLQKHSHLALGRMLEEHGTAQRIGQGAIVVMGLDGAIKAMIGGRNYRDSQFNRVSQAQRQPGSAFKLFVYLAALEAGVGAETNVLDGPVALEGWTPSNIDGTYRGDVNVRQAFSLSLNTPAVRVSEYIGRDKVIDMARRLGIQTQLVAHPSVALGAVNVNLLELTSAYGVVANGGKRFAPWGVALVRSRNGTKVYYRNQQAKTLRTLVAKKHSQGMIDLLRDTVRRGSGQGASLSRGVAGKTGTSQNFRDAWFIGFTTDYIGGIWLGNDDEEAMRNVTGGNRAAQLWRTVMQEAHQGFPPRFFADNESPARISRVPDVSPSMGTRGPIGTLMERLGL
ncbi:MAG: PBP1A family penicillin-binding protein [Alphaproteobacteria bacterium GM202ARS2]|nr:PBP1A family penicillin-binding protein [Alphaproteobacteria bacterium GM202ARS2]